MMDRKPGFLAAALLLLALCSAFLAGCPGSDSEGPTRPVRARRGPDRAPRDHRPGRGSRGSGRGDPHLDGNGRRRRTHWIGLHVRGGLFHDPITAANFDAATVFTQTWTPLGPGDAETHIVTGLTDGEAYHFAIKALDEMENASVVSNDAFVNLDTTAPDAVIDLAVAPGAVYGSVVLTWTAPGDDAATGTASSYVVKYSTSVLDSATFDAAATYPLARAPRVGGSAETLTVTGLTPSTIYYFALKAVDDVPLTGAISNVENTQAAGFGDVTAVAAGIDHCLVLKSDGTVWAFGNNHLGQLGDGTRFTRHAPVQVSGLTGITAIAAGGHQSAALKDDNTLWTWGDNLYGQLGDATNLSRTTPVQVSALANVTAVAVGRRSMVALDSSLNVFTWGGSSRGQRGNGGTVDSNAPAQVGALSNVTRVWSGDFHCFAEVTSNTIWGWGANDFGQLGDQAGTPSDELSPVQITALFGISDLAPGADFTIALENDGTLLGSGRNSYGTLGREHDTTAANSTPVSVLDGSAVDFGVASSLWGSGGGGNFATFIIKADGSVWAWGRNHASQLGDGTVLSKFYPQQISTLANVSAIACGETHGVALLSDATIQTWGGDFRGQLGDGIGTANVVPGQVCETGAVRALAASEGHSLLIRENGTVFAMGRNDRGQLGDGTWQNRNKEVHVQGVTGATQGAAGALHSLFLRNDGTVMAVGANPFGQLGDGTNTDRLLAVTVSGLTDVVGVSAGADHSATVLADGTVWTFGRNDHGQLGDGTVLGSLVPIQVSGLSGVVAVSCGYHHTLALQGDGTLWAFGANTYGQLGDGTTVDRRTPVAVTGLAGVTAMAAGGHHGAALLSDSTVWCFGRNAAGQLGDDTNTDSSTPVQAGTIDDATAVAAGTEHTLALRSAGRIWAFGANLHGQLGINTQANALSPQKLKGISDATALAGGSHTLILRSDGSVFACGNNVNGQLGEGTTTSRNLTLRVGGFKAASGSSYFHALALRADGSVWSWGQNSNGQCGMGSSGYNETPARIAGFSNVSTIASNPYHSLILCADGRVWAIGYNGYGQCGTMDTSNAYAPFRVPDLEEVTAVTTGEAHSVVLLSDGTVWCFGRNTYGQCGNGRFMTREYRPVQVQGLTGVSAIGAGQFWSCALKSDGTLWTWGYDLQGQLGNDATAQNSSIPVAVAGLANVTKFAVGNNHGMALLTDGTLWAWGGNGDGRVGDDTIIDAFTPVQVKDAAGTGTLANVQEIEAGTFSIALLTDGTVWTWGGNGDGELGIGAADSNPHPLPVQVTLPATATSILAANNGAAAFLSDGTLQVWGRNDWGQLGDGSIGDQPAPVPFTYLTVANIAQLVLADRHSLVLLNDGSVWGYGYNSNGAVGDGTNQNRTTAAVELKAFGAKITSTAAGQYHSVLVASDESVWTFGYNGHGQLGNNETGINRYSPFHLSTPTGIIGAACGRYHTLATDTAGVMWSWGYNGHYELGWGGTTQQPSPGSPVFPGGERIGTVEGGRYFTVALQDNGTIWAWGENGPGQIGNGTFSAPIAGPYNPGIPWRARAVAAFHYHTMAIHENGSVWTWGHNNFGQLGRGTAGIDDATPGQVVGLANAVSIASGAYYSAAVLADGSVWTWGYNAYGQLGDGTVQNSLAPVKVPNIDDGVSIFCGYYTTYLIRADGSLWAWGYGNEYGIGDGKNLSRATPVPVQEFVE